MEDLTGKQLGPYRIVSPLGEGGMAAVYKAYQASMDRYVALKILPRHFASDPEFVGRFTQEAKVIANLQHPHILPVHDFGEADGYTYLVMRFIEGGTLSDWLIERTPLPMPKILHIISQVGGALDYAHARGVIHRDIKPSNILVDQWDNCLLTDFGLAKMVEGSSYLTQTGGILGTPAYMSPEQGLGRKVDHRTDIYSLGVVLYQMAVGYLPYQAETPMAVVIKHIHDPLPPPTQRHPTLPEAVEKVILKSLAKDPNDRYAAAGDLVKALQSTTDVTTPAEAVPAQEQARPATPPDAATEAVAPPEAEPAEAPGMTEVMQRLESTELSTAEEQKPRPTPKPVAAEPVRAAVAPRPKSKLPWILGGIAAVLVIAVLAIAVGGLLSGEGEEDVPSVAEGGEPTAPVEVVESNVEVRPPEPEEVEQLPGPEGPAASLDEVLAQVDTAYGGGDLVRAKELLDEAVALNPGVAELLCYRGYVLNDLEAFNEAAANFDQCQAMAGEQGLQELQQEGWAMLAVTRSEYALSVQENPELAIQTIDEALANPIAPDWLLCHKAEIYLTIGDRPEAMETFDACSHSDQLDEYWSVRSQAAVFQIQGELAEEEEQYQAAVESFNRWAELEPEEPWPYCSLGDAYLSLEVYDQSAFAFERCRERASDPDAQRWAEVGIRVSQANEAMVGEDWDAALQLFGEAVDIAPDEAWLYCERASLYIAIEAEIEASRDIQTCLDLAGDDPDITQWVEELQGELQGG